MTNENWLIRECKELEAKLDICQSVAMCELRRQALSRFREQSIPTTKNEAWKYTDLSFFKDLQFNNAPSRKYTNILADAAHLDRCKQVIEPFLMAESHAISLVFVDGNYCPLLSNDVDISVITNSDNGVFISTLSEAFLLSNGIHLRDQVEARLDDFTSINTRPFAALNTAFFQDGLFIRVERDAVVNHPINIIYVVSGALKDVAVYPRLILEAKESSSITLIESFVGVEDISYFACGVSQIYVGANAKVDHFRFVSEGNKATHISSCDIKQGRDSSYTLHLSSFGGRLVRNEIYPTLMDEGVETNLFGLSIVKGNQHVDNYTLVEHEKPHSTSVEKFKGVYSGKSRGAFTGTIVVQKEAQKTNAYQSNASLLLSDDAEIDTRPQLKIWADDVKCSHGATVGHLNNDALFYLRSRGIDEDIARRMLIEAFANDVLDTVKIETMRDRMAELISRELYRAQKLSSAGLL